MSGRGLGHTGGTLDKLESIPGYRVELEIDAFVRQVAEIGLAVIGQSERLVPADRRLYALRDHTATVDEISLIAASVMSKKLAAGADAILLDVKVGDGAFMKTREDGRRLASAMLAVAREADRRVSCELSGMDQPLGRAVGNALEVREALATLRGEGPPDLLELAVRSAATLVRLAGAAATEEEATRAAEAALASGAALEAYERWVVAQGGDPREESLPAAPVVRPVPAPGEGYVRSVDALGIARAAVRLGAGRMRKGQPVDHATGIVCLRRSGDAVAAGEPLAEVHARDEASADAVLADVTASYVLSAERHAPPPVVLEVVE
jgi:pyrimidine-nucleoside phosphorylase